MNSSNLFSVLILALVFLLGSSEGKTGENFTPKEKSALDKFRPLVEDVLVKDYEKTDTFLMRWLRAKELDIKEAEKMLRTAQKWRKDNRIDGILKETILTFPRPPFVIDGVDKGGSPIVTLYPARVDTRRRVIAGQESLLVRYFDQFLETAATYVRETNGNSSSSITQNVNIYDFTNYNVKQQGCLGCFPIYVDWVRHYENYFPELSKMLVFVNLPRVAVPLVEVLRPAMSPSTQKTFKVFGPDRQEWAPFLLKYIKADQLTYQFGGTRKTKPN